MAARFVLRSSPDGGTRPSANTLSMCLPRPKWRPKCKHVRASELAAKALTPGLALRADGIRRPAMKLLHAALLAAAIAQVPPAAADIDASLADARLVGMPIYTADGLLIGQVT